MPTPATNWNGGAARHCFASRLAAWEVDEAIQELFGRATMEMTMHDAHLAPVVYRDAVAALDGPSPSQSDLDECTGPARASEPQANQGARRSP